MPSNTKENGFETLIVDTLVNSNPSFRKWLFDSAFNSTYQANHNQTSL